MLAQKNAMPGFAQIALYIALAVGQFLPTIAHAERIKDLATVQGVRSNQLIGYGLVVGLDGTGDQTTQSPFTVQSMINMLQNMGVSIPPGTTIQSKNTAAVMVTATLPAYTKPGQSVDVTVSSMGNAKSLRGGTLLMTPLKGIDGQTYALAQGNVIVSGAGQSAGGSSVQINHLSVGRVPGGAMVEREVATPLGQGEYVHIELNRADFTTAKRLVEAINARFMGNPAAAVDGRMVQVRAPLNPDQRVSFLAALESLELNAAPMPAKVIINSRTGSVVMNQRVEIEECAVAHGNLSVVVSKENSVSQPDTPLGGGQTVTTQNTNISVDQEKGSLIRVKSGTSLAEVVKALNAIGANPQDLQAILQAMKVAGALKAELEII